MTLHEFKADTPQQAKEEFVKYLRWVSDEHMRHSTETKNQTQSKRHRNNSQLLWSLADYVQQVPIVAAS